MRVLYAGTPDLAVPTLRAIQRSHHVCAVLTNPARRVGRSSQLVQPPVQVAASELGIPVLQPESLRTEARRLVAELSPSVLVAFAFGRIFGPRFLDLFPAGSVNVHTSLLPAYRGPSPIQAALAAGERVTGVTIQKIALDVDSGDILAQREISLSGDETATVLAERLGQTAAEMVPQLLDQMERGPIKGRAQDHSKATYCRLVTREDGRIDWALAASQIYNRYRAYTPWPGIWTTYGQTRLVLHRCSAQPLATSSGIPGQVIGVDKSAGLLVQTGDGVLAVEELQLQAKKSMDFRSFLNGNSAILGAHLGDLS